MNSNITKSNKQCIDCGIQYYPNSNRQLRCIQCIARQNRKLCSARYHKTKILKGYNQVKENNNAYTNGSGFYKKLALTFWDNICVRCLSKENLVVHHVNMNRKDNLLDNLTILCKSCHQHIHASRDYRGRYTSSKE